MIICIIQVLYFKFSGIQELPFVFLFGIEKGEFSGAQYIDICAKWLIECFIIVFFAGHYSFYLENYGRVLIVRDCKRSWVLASLIVKCVLELVGFIMCMTIINAIFFPEYTTANWKLVICGAVQILFSYIALVEIIICLCIKVKENVVIFLLSIYTLGSNMILYGKVDEKYRLILYPWENNLWGKNNLQYGYNEVLFWESILTKTILMISVYIIINIIYRKKDIF